MKKWITTPVLGITNKQTKKKRNEKKRKATKKTCERYQNISREEKKNANIVVSDIKRFLNINMKTFLNMKNKSWLSIEKSIMEVVNI